MMRNLTIFLTAIFLVYGCDNGASITAKDKTEAAVILERPTDAELQAFKVYHHAVYLVTTAEQAGGTNKLHHST